VRYWIGITDWDWFQFLRAGQPLDEVNFWQPNAGRPPAALDRGAAFLFKLHAADGGLIVGGGFFLRYSALAAQLAWETFGEENGAAAYAGMLARIQKYRKRQIDPFADEVGCSILAQPFFFDEADWVAPPHDWAPNIVQGKTYDSDVGEGRRVWDDVVTRMRMPASDHAVAEVRYGPPILVHPRLGQGAFRVEVLEAYARRCALTGERTVPVLDAAHIRPYAEMGPHRVDNGLLLRKDLHALFDAGYITVTPSYRLRVSRRIREQYENGRDYYALQDRELRLPLPPGLAPAREFLEWHADVKFKG
jgi:putative restriction endonuclease